MAKSKASSPHAARRPLSSNGSAATVTVTPHRVARSGRVIKFGKPRPQAAGEPSDLAALFGVEPFLRNQVTKENIDHLRNRIDSEGIAKVAESLELSIQALLYVCSGFGHRCRPTTAQKIRGYFGTEAANGNRRR